MPDIVQTSTPAPPDIGANMPMTSSSRIPSRPAMARPTQTCAASGHSFSLARLLVPLEAVIRDTSSNWNCRSAIPSLPSSRSGAPSRSDQLSHPSGGAGVVPTRRVGARRPVAIPSSQVLRSSSMDSGDTKTALGSICRKVSSSSRRRHCIGAKQPRMPAFLNAMRSTISRLDEGICTRARPSRGMPRAIRAEAIRSVASSSCRHVRRLSQSRQAIRSGHSRA